jgi:16S rRNA (guanine966-N2)-methyltransferase
LKGAAISGARPTSELVRGAIFNVLGPLDLKQFTVLDLYAGSGSLGIEALSRGAGWANFVERHPSQCAAIRDNLAATAFTERARVYCMDVRRALTVLEGDYRLVLMDPPYKLTSLEDVLDSLGGSKLLEEGATVVVGHSKRLSLRSGIGSLALVASHRYGDSVVDFFENRGP